MTLAGEKACQNSQTWIWRCASERTQSVRFWGFYFFTTPAGGA